MKMTAMHQKKRAGASRWMNKWVQSPRWMLGFAVAAVLSIGVYTVNAAVSTVRPSSPWGLGYGIAATVLLASVLLHAVRRRTLRFRRLGRSWTYLQVHVYGGTLFLLLLLMHTGFSMPRGMLTGWLYALSIWLVASGFLGIVIQKWIPTVLNAGFPIEIHYDRVPELVETIRVRAEKIARDADERVAAFYEESLAPAMAAPRPHIMFFFDTTGGARIRRRSFGTIRRIVAPEEREALDELERLYRSKIEIDAHYTLQKALRSWLMLHVPVSVVMVTLLIVHIATVIYY